MKGQNLIIEVHDIETLLYILKSLVSTDGSRCSLFHVLLLQGNAATV